ncbi:MAG: tetratricopeptide repeat protein [Lachnospiraceae bacterium]|nr:tetratricopeptide repeat protein [Lachnospiraceae bacterium]
MMILDKEDWQEPGCCFRPAAAAEEIQDGGQGARIHEVIAGLDACLARDQTGKASVYLEKWLLHFEASGDWASQITVLNEMMGLYRNTGEREKGLGAVERGLALVKEHGLSETVSGGTTFVNAATTMKAFGRAKEAMPYYEQAFRAYGRKLSPKDYRFGGLFNNMALAFEALGEYKKAEAYYKKAMEIMEGLRPGSALEIAVTWVNLAVLYEKWDRGGECDDCLLRALEGFQDTRVPRDAYYAFNCRKCADTFGHFGYFRAKRELSEAADQIYGGAEAG